jgi:hypothetical protein
MAERLRARRLDSYRGDAAPVFATLAGTELSRPNLAGRVLKPAAAAIARCSSSSTSRSQEGRCGTRSDPPAKDRVG